jgi:alkyl hydroperoxide reductase subunit D
MSQAVAIQNETFLNLLGDLQLGEYHPSEAAQVLLQAESRYIRDLRINVGNALNNNQHLNRKEAALLAFAVAVNERSGLLKGAFSGLARQAGASEAELAEVIACTSLMNTNNIFYRFRHFVKKETYTAQPAGIKMTIMANPLLGKEFFELLSLVVSSVNGCELCVTSHEQSVLQHGGSESRILEAVRLGAVVKGLITVFS